jgi:hypothetical protein|tara:strand:- start:1783 stop:2328 length:546 start_codon:yes stop_codon:yes gene_type:complete
MAVVEETRAGWMKDLSDSDIEALKGYRYLLQRPGNSALNWTLELAVRTDMTEINGLQNMELQRTGGIVSIGLFAGKDGKPRSNPNLPEHPPTMSEEERMELEAQQAEKHAEELRKNAEDQKKLRVLDEAKEEIRPRPSAPDYGVLDKDQLVAWAKENLGKTIKLPASKKAVVAQIEKLIAG